MRDLFTGERVRLVAVDPEKEAEYMAAWRKDSEFGQLWDSDPAMPMSLRQLRARTEEWATKPHPGRFSFMIELVESGERIGHTALWNTFSTHQDAWISIGIGNREHWGKGYGTEAMQLVMDFGFDELDIERITLITFEYNRRAIRAYEKLGFAHEGRVRGMLLRYGRRWDGILMGILRQERKRG
jgi:RimJ/RimL family protein N-acetyltransferase